MEGMPRFIVEVGSLHGHSAIQMAMVLDKLQMTEAASFRAKWESGQEKLGIYIYI